jgi:predicted transcriptional regulator
MARRKAKKIYDVVNPKTQEKVDQIYEGDIIRRGNSSLLLSETTSLNTKEDFIKIFVKPLMKLSSILSNSEAWTITYMLQYLDYTSGVLKLQDGKVITIDDLMDGMELKPSSAYNIVQKLIAKEVIGKTKIGDQVCILMNPYIFMKGKRVSNTLVELFKSTEWARVFKTRLVPTREGENTYEIQSESDDGN